MANKIRVSQVQLDSFNALSEKAEDLFREIIDYKAHSDEVVVSLAKLREEAGKLEEYEIVTDIYATCSDLICAIINRDYEAFMEARESGLECISGHWWALRHNIYQVVEVIK